MKVPKPDGQLDPLELLTVDDVAGLLKVKKSWIYDQVSVGSLPGVKIGHHLRFRRSAIAAFLEAREVRPQEGLSSSGLE